MAVEPSADRPESMGQPLQALQPSPIWPLIQAIAGASCGGVATPVCVMADTDRPLAARSAERTRLYPSRCTFAGRVDHYGQFSSGDAARRRTHPPTWGRQPGGLTGRHEILALSFTSTARITWPDVVTSCVISGIPPSRQVPTRFLEPGNRPLSRSSPAALSE